MVKVKDTHVYIGDDIYEKLPKAEQKKFKELDRYYKMCEWAEYMELDPETGEEVEYHEWGGDKCFKDIEDLRDFFGDDECWTISGTSYERKYEVFTGEEEKVYEDLSKWCEKEGWGNQLRIKHV